MTGDSSSNVRVAAQERWKSAAVEELRKVGISQASGNHAPIKQIEHV
jgi:hypothetical protein